jgi:hypothetical protein
MKHTIKLIKDHKEILLETLAQSLEIKEAKLVKKDSIAGMRRQYYDAAEKIYNGEIVCGRSGALATDNLFGWMIDQIKHSGKLYKNELGQYSILICRAAAEGEYEYQQFHNPLPRLFDHV